MGQNDFPELIDSIAEQTLLLEPYIYGELGDLIMDNGSYSGEGMYQSAFHESIVDIEKMLSDDLFSFSAEQTPIGVRGDLSELYMVPSCSTITEKMTHDVGNSSEAIMPSCSTYDPCLRIIDTVSTTYNADQVSSPIRKTNRLRQLSTSSSTASSPRITKRQRLAEKAIQTKDQLVAFGNSSVLKSTPEYQIKRVKNTAAVKRSRNKSKEIEQLTMKNSLIWKEFLKMNPKPEHVSSVLKQLDEFEY